MDRDEKLINEMAAGMGGAAMGPSPEEKMAEGAFGEDDMDMGPPGMDDMDMDDMDMDDEGELEEDESVSCDKGDLRRILDAVEMGEQSADEAFDELCGEMMDDMDMDMPMDDMDMGSPDMDDMSMEEACMESVQFIASLITDDPDILSEAERKKCPECKSCDIPPSISMCRECDKRVKTPPPQKSGPKKKKKELEDTDA